MYDIKVEKKGRNRADMAGEFLCSTGVGAVNVASGRLHPSPASYNRACDPLFPSYPPGGVLAGETDGDAST